MDNSRDETQRPVHLVYDLQAGTETYVPLSDEEWDEHEERKLQSQQQEQERLAELEQDAADEQAIRERAQQDPAFAALARKLGV